MGDLWPSIARSTSPSSTYSNTTLCYEKSSREDEDPSQLVLFRDYPESLLKFASTCCVLFMLVGIPGNLITIIALAKCKKVRNATAVFIMNLSCSDLLFCCFNLPLAASTFWSRAWPHGRTACRMFPLMRYALVAVSLFTVLAITINRYVMIGHPRLYPKLYQRKYLAVMVSSTWACAFGALAATWFERWGRFGLDVELGSCSILPDHRGRSPKEFLFVVAFVLPCLSILVCYARIFLIVRATAKKTRAPVRSSKDVRVPVEDSALGSVSTGADRSSAIENGCTHLARATPASPQASHALLATPSVSHALLAPPSRCTRARSPADRSSSSGVDTLDGDVEDVESSEVARTPAPQRPHRPHRTRSGPGKLTAKDRKLLKMIMVIMASFWICYLPITLTKIFRGITEFKGMNIAGYILIYLTTCINPIIYVVMSSEYRQAYKNLLMCRGRA